MAVSKIPDTPEFTSKFGTFFEAANRLRTVPGLKNPFIPDDVWNAHKGNGASNGAAVEGPLETMNGHKPGNGHTKEHK